MDEQTLSPASPDDLVILVHGTFAASDADQGQSWWQVGSTAWEELSSRLPHGVRLQETGEVFHWSGENSERDRIKAGHALLERLTQLETQGVSYHLIGHSHGGSVIWHALRRAELQKKQLDGLRSWATVGTPFMHHRTRSAWSLKNIVNLVLALILFRPAWNSAREIFRLLGQSMFGVGELILIPPERNNGLLAVLRAPVLKTVELLGVSVVTTEEGIRVGTFDPASGESMGHYLFMTGEGLTILLVVLAAAYVFLNLAVFFISPVLESLRIRAEDRLEDNVMQKYKRIWLGLWSPEDEAINGLRATLDLSISFVHQMVPRERILLSDSISLISRPYFWVLAPVYNRILRPILDGVVRTFVVKHAQGNNRPSAEVIAVSPVPVAQTKDISYPSLPEDLNERIVARADLAASDIAPKLRRLMSQTSFVSGLDAFSHALSGHELVHTSYFDHAEILDLLAMHIAWATRNREYFADRDERQSQLLNWLSGAKSASGVQLASIHSPAVPDAVPPRPLIRPRRRTAA